MDQQWFEFTDLGSKRFDKAAWVPLRSSQVLISESKYGELDYKYEYFGAMTLAVIQGRESEAQKLDWHSLSGDHGSYVDNNQYFPSDIRTGYDGQSVGLNLVIHQSFNSNEKREWHLHQDLVVALKLMREGDSWICTTEGYIEVARLQRDIEGEPCKLVIKTEFLKDYLCARNLSLMILSLRNRREVTENTNHISWDGDRIESISGDTDLKCWVSEIHEGGKPFGAKTHVIHVERTDIDPKEDVPEFDFPPNGKTKSKSWDVESQNRKLYAIFGELQRREWVKKGTSSPRIKNDNVSPTAFFVTDASGKKESRETLDLQGRWLWFKPEIVNEALRHRGNNLEWYTGDTGKVGLSPDDGVHFGINKLGLINVHAKEIAYLPDWQQNIWAGYNIAPNGGVSEELQDSQVRASPSKTQAPEMYLGKGLKLLNIYFLKHYGFILFREHDLLPEIIKKTHRFRATDEPGVLSLSKDITRLTADSIDAKSIQNILSPSKKVEWGSLKSLEKLIASKVAPDKAREVMSPLAGAYELRLGDAHLPKTEIEEAFKLLRVNREKPLIYQGKQLLSSVVSSLFDILDIFEGNDQGREQ